MPGICDSWINALNYISESRVALQLATLVHVIAASIDLVLLYTSKDSPAIVRRFEPKDQFFEDWADLSVEYWLL